MKVCLLEIFQMKACRNVPGIKFTTLKARGLHIVIFLTATPVYIRHLLCVWRRAAIFHPSFPVPVFVSLFVASLPKWRQCSDFRVLHHPVLMVFQPQYNNQWSPFFFRSLALHAVICVLSKQKVLSCLFLSFCLTHQHCNGLADQVAPLSATLASYVNMIVCSNQMQLHPNPLARLKEPASAQRNPICRAASQWSAKMTDDKPEK